MTSLEQGMRQEDLHVGGTKAGTLKLQLKNKTTQKAKQKEEYLVLMVLYHFPFCLTKSLIVLLFQKCSQQSQT